MRPVHWGSKRAISIPFVVVLSLLFVPGTPVGAVGASLRPPETIELYYKLFVNVRSLTGPPFTMFPGLGGADKTKFLADDLINRDELLHTTAYLKGQLVISIVTSPDTVKELQASINVCEFLSRNFYRIATQEDARGSLAIGEDDIERLFAPTPERGSERRKIE